MSTPVRSVGVISGSIVGKRTVGLLSDGTAVAIMIDNNSNSLPAAGGGDASNVRKIYVYTSADRLSWTLRNTVVPTAPIAIDRRPWSATVDGAGNIHIVYVSTALNLVYKKLTFSAGPSWAVGADETVFTKTGTLFIDAVDIDTIGSSTTPVVAAVTGPTSSSFHARTFVRRTSDNAWIAQTIQATGHQGAYYGWTLDITIACDAAGIDGANQFYYAVNVVRRDNTNGDIGDVLWMFKSTSTTGAFVSATVIQGSTGINGYNKGLGGGYRKTWIFSTGPAEYTLVSVISTAKLSIGTYRWTYAGGVLAELSPNQVQETNNSYVQSDVWGWTAVAYSNDKAVVFLTNGATPMAQVVKFTRGLTATTVTIPSYWYSWDDFYANANAHTVYMGSGNNNNLSLNKFDMLYYFANFTTVWDVRHQHNVLPSLSTGVTPAAGSTVATDLPIMTHEFRLQQRIPQVRVKSRFQIANNATFTSGLKTFTSPDSDFGQPVDTQILSTKIIGQLAVDIANQISQGSWYIRAASYTELDDVGPYTTGQLFTVSHPPSATNLFPNNDKVFDYAGTGNIAFSWKFTDASPVDNQSAYQIVVERADTGVSIADSGKIISTDETATLIIPVGGKDLRLRWRIRLWDSDDVAGPYSSYQTFFVSDPPTVTITNPTNASVITTANPTVAWDFFNASARAQAVYRVILTQAGVTKYDTGEVAGSATSRVIPVNILQNTTAYLLTVYVRDTGGLFNSSTIGFSTSWTPPAAPAFTVSNALYKASGFIRVSWTNSTADADFIAYRVYRRKTGTTAWELLKEIPILQGSYTFDDWTAGSGVQYDYTVTQVVDRFASIVESIPVPASTTGSSEYYWLIHLTDSTKNFLLYNVVSDDYEEEYEEETYALIGRGRHVDYGDRLGYTGSLKAQLRDRTGLTARQQKTLIEILKAEKQEMFLRNPFGDVWRVSASNIAVSRLAGVGTAEFCDVTIPYQEVGV